MIISTSTVILIAPPAVAKPLPAMSAIPSAPSTIGQDGKDGDFSTQAALQIPRTFQSTDIVSSAGIYEVSFTTSTAEAVDKIEIVFPADTNIGAAGVIEKVGIGGGVLTKVGTTLTYDVTTPVNIPAGTFIRLEISGIKNPTLPSNTLTATITTKDSGGTPIDGPSVTNVYKMRRIGTNDLAVDAVTSQKIDDGAITTTKPDESFMKRVTVQDDAAGHAVGWNPDAVALEFTISEPDVSGQNTALISIEVVSGTNHFCDVTSHSGIAQSFTIDCFSAPGEGTTLHYLVENLPAHIVQ